MADLAALDDAVREAREAVREIHGYIDETVDAYAATVERWTVARCREAVEGGMDHGDLCDYRPIDGSHCNCNKAHVLAALAALDALSETP